MSAMDLDNEGGSGASTPKESAAVGSTSDEKPRFEVKKVCFSFLAFLKLIVTFFFFSFLTKPLRSLLTQSGTQ